MLIKTLLFWMLLLITGLSFVVIASSSFKYGWKRLSHKLFCSFMFTSLWLFITAVLYWHWGAWPELRQSWQEQENRVEVNKIVAEYRRDPQQLIHWFNTLLAKHPADARGWYYLGKLYTAQKQYGDALDAYQKALHLNPDEFSYQSAYAEAVRNHSGHG